MVRCNLTYVVEVEVDDTLGIGGDDIVSDVVTILPQLKTINFQQKSSVGRTRTNILIFQLFQKKMGNKNPYYPIIMGYVNMRSIKCYLKE